LDRKPGKLDDDIKFGRWAYTWQEKDYILCQVQYYTRYGMPKKVFVLLYPGTTEDAKDGHLDTIDSLILAASQWTKEPHDEIYVFDNEMWKKDKELYLDVKGASWDDVILDPAMKRSLVQDVLTFFDNRDLYASLNVSWKRGVVFHGGPGNGKTISPKALINSLSKREETCPVAVGQVVRRMPRRKMVDSIDIHACTHHGAVLFDF
jgi:hypothetical protein